MKHKLLRIGDDKILLFYYRIPDNLKEETVMALISRFSVSEQTKFNAILNKNSRNQKLFGMIILNYIAANLGLNKPDYLHFTSSGKPEFKTPSRYNFNISHSGNRVVCCITKNAQIGIDLELIRPVDIEIYRSYFDWSEWQFITNSENSEIAFLKLWVRKEAVIKADGKGMEIDLHSIYCIKNSVETESNTWHIHDVEISPDYVCAVACNKYKNLMLLDFATVFEMEDFNVLR